MARKQSSAQLSSLAARVLNGAEPTPSQITQLAASVLSQDEEPAMKKPSKPEPEANPAPETDAPEIIPENEGWGQRQAREAREAEKRLGEQSKKADQP